MSKIRILRLTTENGSVQPRLAQVDRQEAHRNLRRAVEAAARLKAYAETQQVGFIPKRLRAVESEASRKRTK